MQELLVEEFLQQSQHEEIEQFSRTTKQEIGQRGYEEMLNIMDENHNQAEKR